MDSGVKPIDPAELLGRGSSRSLALDEPNAITLRHKTRGRDFFLPLPGPDRHKILHTSSNGKLKGTGNAKNGNAYLSWAVTELANLIVRFNKTAAKMYARLFKKYGKLRVKAIRSLAARLARAIYHVLKTKKPFDEEKCFGFRVVEAESC